MKLKFWFCLLVLFTVAGCKDECDDYNNYDLLNDEIRPYLFKEGTYWIYQNSVTGQTDSEYVSRVYNALDTSVYIKYTCGVNYSVADEIRMTHKSTELLGDSLIWYSLGGVSSFIGTEKDGIKYPLLFLSNKNNLISANNCLLYKGFFGQLNVLGNIFYSVDCFIRKTDTICESAFLYTTDFYFAANYGIIKKVEYNTPNGTQEWNLIRWKIVQ